MSGDPHHLPRHTTPTWEVELLISGVAVFAMLQLPGWLDDRVFALLPRLGADWADPATLIYIYAKSAAIILAMTFALHLLLRAHWIALVGMHSIYPDGVRWERLRMGPIQRDAERRRARPAADAIERADNRATTVFAIGVMLATVMLWLTVIVFAGYLVGISLAREFGIDVDPALLFAALGMSILMPYIASSLFDRHFGHRLAPDSWLARLLSRVMSFYSRIGMGRWSGAMRLVASHEGERGMMLVTVLVFAIACTSAILSFKFLKDPREIGDYAAFPAFADGSRTVDSAHYDDQRDAAHDPSVAYIQSAISIGPYLRLTVPYDPRRDAAAMHGCAIPAGTSDAKAAARLDCLQSLHGVQLDGTPIDLQFELGSDARTDRPALVAMIDVRALAPGRHELQVARPPESGEKDEDDPGFDRIPFWK
ncbi:MAG: hypothetical protein QM719_01450 [Thermomonas sp.]